MWASLCVPGFWGEKLPTPLRAVATGIGLIRPAHCFFQLPILLSSKISDDSEGQDSCLCFFPLLPQGWRGEGAGPAATITGRQPHDTEE